ncbi:MAG: hypothetical protein SOT55_06455, partial [Candidatus Cryptobacteroides sp.]|nr:hypothetical protein [Candidatus Cryptobacteroides sp.]
YKDKKRCSMEIIKQLFDVASIFDQTTDLEVAKNTFSRIVPVESCLREIHLAPAIIDYQAVSPEKGLGEPNLVPPGTGICPVGLSGGVGGARWTQIDAIARVDVPLRALEGRFGCQVNCRKSRARALTRL